MENGEVEGGVEADAEVEASVIAARKLLESFGYTVLLPLTDGMEYEVNVKPV